MFNLRKKLRMIVVFLMAFIGGCNSNNEQKEQKQYYKSDNVRILLMRNMEEFTEDHITRIEYDNEVCFLSQGWNAKGMTQSLSCVKK